MISVNIQFSQLQNFSFFGSMSHQPQVKADSDVQGTEYPIGNEQKNPADAGTGAGSDTVKLSKPLEDQKVADKVPENRETTKDNEAQEPQEPGSSPTSPATADQAAGVSAAFQGVNFQDSRSLSLEIKTREGDTVTVHFAQDTSGSTAALAVNNETGSGSAAQADVEKSTQASFSIEGDLSKKEHKAIEHLMKRLDKVAEKFFSSDMEGVMKRLGKLGFNEQQLAGFSFDLNHQQSLQAVSAYYGTGSSAGTDDLAKAVDFTHGLKELPRPDFIQDPGKDVGRLLSGVIENKAEHEGHKPPDHDILHRMEKLMDKTFKLADSVFA